MQYFFPCHQTNVLTVYNSLTKESYARDEGTVCDMYARWGKAVAEQDATRQQRAKNNNEKTGLKAGRLQNTFCFPRPARSGQHSLLLASRHQPAHQPAEEMGAAQSSCLFILHYLRVPRRPRHSKGKAQCFV